MPALSEGEFSALVADLFEAAVSADAAARLPVSLARAARGASAALWIFEPQTGALCDRLLINQPAEMIAEYGSHFYTLDPYTAPLARARRTDVIRGSDLVDPRALQRSAYYADFGRHYDMFHLIGAAMPLGESYGSVSVLRPLGMGGFEDDERDVLVRLLPYVQSALRLRAHVIADAAAAVAARAGLDALSAGVVIVDGYGHVLHSNTAALSLAMEGDGLHFGRRGQIVGAPTAAGTDRLRKLIASAAKGGPGGGVLIDTPNGHQYALLVMPAANHLVGRDDCGLCQGFAILVVRSLDAPVTPTSVRAARQLFGLTQAEAEVAGLLASGASPADIALQRNSQLSSVRTLLRRALAKSGAASLRDLARIIGFLRL